ncbi:MAG: Gfo/Idh/MocA family oxidoreductase [Pirellulaceae bacterium]|nr:Gfo/Idh/MocA family oxidoreductase [Planctomycetales bacterium]
MTSVPNRRDFLVHTATTTALLGASIVSPRRAKGETTKRLRAGIIGSTGRGDYGHGVDVAVAKMKQLEVLAVADADEGGRRAARQRTGAAREYADYHEMFAKEELDLVAICPRWIDQHHAMLMESARAGCHVYMEKPFCRTMVECDEVVTAFQQRNLKLALAHISQYSPVLSRVQSLIADGVIGEVLELRARGKEDHRGGAEDLWVLGSHLFGLMRSLAGGEPRHCSATVTEAGRVITAGDVVDGAEGLGPLAGDRIEARFAFDRGIDGYFSSRRNMAASPSRFAIQVMGSAGLIEMESGYLTKAHILRDGSWSPGRSGKNWEVITSAGIGQPEPLGEGTYEAGHMAGIVDLLDSVEQGRPTRSSAEDGRAIVEMIMAIFESQRRAAMVPMPLAMREHPLTQLAGR